MLGGCGAPAMPTDDEANRAVEDYLRAEKARTCRGTVMLESLRVTRVEPFDASLKGFPVHSQFSVTCRDGNVTTTWTDSGDGSAMTAVLRPTTFSGYEAVMPEMFREAQRMIEQQFNEALKKGLR